jgi:cellulose synthase/poly-beta-1,6-N-acetylglucosamine synthase-like glycosyltransferase
MAPVSTAVITSHNDGKMLDDLVRVVVSSDVDRIVLIYGGTSADSGYIDSLKDPRIIMEREEERQGKCAALNRSLKYIEGDYVFLLAGDIEINADIFRRSLLAFTERVGAVVPRVVPKKRRGLTGIIGSVFWKFHDVELSYQSKGGFNAHGGEFLVMRRKLVNEIPHVINDDAYMCINAREKGYDILYDESLTVRNTIPSTLRELLVQRIRINFGHLELLKMKMDPSVLTTLIRSNRKRFLSIMALFARKYRRDLLALPFACALEVFSMIIAGRKFKHGYSYLLWPIATRDMH